MWDIVIQNGLVFDGCGSPPVRQDLAIEQGKIAAIAPHLTQPAHRVIDARGRWITPGFLDIHTHYDLELEIAPGLAESVRHGVTTVIIGNCSLSIAIGEPAQLAAMFQRVETLPHPFIAKWLQNAIAWDSPRGYLEHLQTLPLGPNVAPLFGHSALRAHVMGLERSLTDQPTTAELDRMVAIAQDALDEGFLGISIDMFPWHWMSGQWSDHRIPSQNAQFKEYAALAQICRERDRIFQVTPNPQQFASFGQVIWLGLGLGQKPLKMTVLSALDFAHARQLWRLFSPLLVVWNGLMGGNVRFQTLTEPFTVYAEGPMTPLFEEFPTGAKLNSCRTRSQRQELWRSPTFCAQFRQDWTQDKNKSFHRQLEQMVISSSPRSDWVGLSFAAIAAQNHQDPIEFFMQAMADYDTDLRWSATAANNRLQPRLALMKHRHIFPGFTDAGAHVRNLGYYDGALSLLKQAVTTGFLSPEAAIHRVTGEPAQWFGLETGRLKVGTQADLLILNPQELHTEISPMVAIDDPHLDGELRMVKRGSESIIDAVYIKGHCVVEAGKPGDRLGKQPNGSLLRSHDGNSLKKNCSAGISSTGSPYCPPTTNSTQRNRISDQMSAHHFTDYWDIFVLKHQHPVNIALHLLGIFIFYSLLGTAWFLHRPILLLALPLTQLTGLCGHLLFERSHIDLQDAIFSWRASFCLGRLLWRVMIGKYAQDIESRLEQVRLYHG
ncbi:MAG: amidohydrolase family protein [Cyanobacteria bacterium J06627_3]